MCIPLTCAYVDKSDYMPPFFTGNTKFNCFYYTITVNATAIYARILVEINVYMEASEYSTEVTDYTTLTGTINKRRSSNHSHYTETNV